ncbi:hypothetical protein GXP67_11235 [Rhodocytophaga rosea]|uniref:PorT family protein n=1 Tax=Rhodocytophaga rosea TaxID=2704465 RepID=A0A6C0GGT6_9BACT|nr:hypothetical protein [Rhodocytophaga rosea]QHT67177.1 hypothetical protein GXP67_11235 [Rhodocytophaga rosea]
MSVCLAHAQSSEAKKVSRFLEIGVSANAYRGDLGIKNPKWSSAFQAGLKLNFKKRFNSHFNVAIGSVTGQNPDYRFEGTDATPATPNLFFKTNFVAANYDLQVHLLKYKGIMVYVSQGIGLIRYEPKDAENQSLGDNFESRVANETYGNVSLLLPTQAGVNYIFNNGYGVGLQAGRLNLQTDYLDNISQWGNRKKKDNALLFRFSFMIPLTFE